MLTKKTLKNLTKEDFSRSQVPIFEGGIYFFKVNDDDNFHRPFLVTKFNKFEINFYKENIQLIRITSRETDFWNIPIVLQNKISFLDTSVVSFENVFHFFDDVNNIFFGPISIIPPTVLELVNRILSRHNIEDEAVYNTLINDTWKYIRRIETFGLNIYEKHHATSPYDYTTGMFWPNGTRKTPITKTEYHPSVITPTFGGYIYEEELKIQEVATKPEIKEETEESVDKPVKAKATKKTTKTRKKIAHITKTGREVLIPQRDYRVPLTQSERESLTKIVESFPKVKLNYAEWPMETKQLFVQLYELYGCRILSEYSGYSNATTCRRYQFFKDDVARAAEKEEKELLESNEDTPENREEDISQVEKPTEELVQDLFPRALPFIKSDRNICVIPQSSKNFTEKFMRTFLYDEATNNIRKTQYKYQLKKKPDVIKTRSLVLEELKSRGFSGAEEPLQTHAELPRPEESPDDNLLLYACEASIYPDAIVRELYNLDDTFNIEQHLNSCLSYLNGKTIAGINISLS